MRWTSLLVSGGLAFLLVIAGVFGAGAMAAGPVAEVEPNDTCETAQDLGALEGSVTVAGELAGRSPYPYPGPEETPNVDFFRITAAPGTEIEVLMRGVSSGGGTLDNPFVGIYNANENGCFQLFSDNYGGGGFDVRVVVRVSESGVLIVGASSCCDYPLVNGGPGAGTYTLSLTELQRADSINGTVVDPSGTPLPFVNNIQLFRCAGEACEFVTAGSGDEQGRFSFVNRPSGPYPEPGQGSPYADNPVYLDLYAGDYQVRIFDANYRDASTPIFSLAPGEQLTLPPLTLEVRQPLGTLVGRVLDAETDEALVGASIELQACEPDFCYTLTFASTDEQGRFTIDAGSFGLFEGEYQLNLFSPGYESFSTGRVFVTAGEFGFGDIKLTRIAQIDSISGQLVDAESGEPLPGDAEPFAFVSLQRLAPEGYYELIASTATDAEGRFRFDTSGWYGYIRPGTYVISYFANQYTFGETAPFTIGKDEALDLGEILVQPFGVQVYAGPACGPIPSDGGECRYSLRLRNAQDKTVTLRAWSVVTANNPQNFIFSTFQPQPDVKVRLRPGETQNVRFKFDVPRQVEPGTTVCTSFYTAADGRGFYFNPGLQISGFCVVKEYDGSFRTLSADERVELLQRARSVPEGSRNIR